MTDRPRWLARRRSDLSLERVRPDVEAFRRAAEELSSLSLVSVGGRRKGNHDVLVATVPGVYLPAVARAYELLQQLDDLLPCVEAWCVVKRYHERESSPFPPALWTAHTTKGQADEYAPAIAARYRDKDSRFCGRPDPHPDQPGYDSAWGDRFVVERRAARVVDFVHPDLSADDYVRGIR